MKNIIIVNTGGTILAKAEGAFSQNYHSPSLKAHDVFDQIADKLTKVANCRIVDLATTISQNLELNDYVRLAKKINALTQEQKVDGIVVLHGTNTVEEFAYFLNLTICTRVPIVVTGAYRPNGAQGFDGVRNLYNGILIAVSQRAKELGVLLTFNDLVFTSRDFIKAHSSIADFTGIASCGYVQEDEFYLLTKTTKIHTYQSEFSICDIESLPEVYILYGYNADQSMLIDALMKAKAKGIVSAGVGKGYQSTKTNLALQKARESGIVVVRSSRALRSLVLEDKFLKGNFIHANDLNPQKARILLALALSYDKNHQEIQQAFAEY